MKTNNIKIQERQRTATPIAYSSLSIDTLGVLKERTSLLDERIVEGYGYTWGSVNAHGEKFLKGAFSKSITDLGPASRNTYEIKFRDRHGKSCSLFAELREDDIGLYFKTKPLDNVSWADDLLTQIKSGTINNFSIGFRYLWDKVEWDEDNDCLVIIECRLFEISAVDIPSDTSTFVIRSEDEPEYLLEEIEEFVASLPKSKQLEARKIITRCMSLVPDNEPLDQREKHSGQESKPAEVGLDFNYINSKF